MASLAVIGALKEELACIQESNLGILCVLSGMGKTAASRAATELCLNNEVSHVVNLGSAGGIASQATKGTPILVTSCIEHDFKKAKLQTTTQMYNERWEKALTAPYCKGLVASGDHPIVSLSAKNALIQRYPSLIAVDMETAAIAHVCAHYGMPLTSVKIISDAADGAEDAASYIRSHVGPKLLELLRRFLES